jgi:hypothetical protein
MNCRTCHAPIDPETRFCPQCGIPLPGATAGQVSSQKALEGPEFDVAEVTRLRAEKDRLSQELHGMIIAAQERELTSAERRQWSDMYTKWRDVSYLITARMDYLFARQEHDRRQQERRRGERRKQQMAIEIPERREDDDRRQGERRSGDDRRDPFWNNVP